MYSVQGLGKKTISRILGISKNTVKKYCEGGSVPWERNKNKERERPVITVEVEDFIKSCLDQDEKENIKKQKHTATRIYDRLVDECDFAGGESTVRMEVSKIKDKFPKVFIPLDFAPGEAVQIDWGEATVYLDNKKVVVNIFCMRLCYNCDIFVKAFFRQNEESFLEGIISGFEYFGGVPRKVIFDNAKVAVKEGFGSVAKAQDRYIALKSHYAFEPIFCNPSSGNEKGLVENLVGWFRRNVMVPLPKVKDMSELNKMFCDKCVKYRQHQIKGRELKVYQMYEIESNQLISLPKYQFDPSKTLSVRVDEFATIKFDYNKYSVPVRYSGKEVTVKGYGLNVCIMYRNETLAEFERSYLRNEAFYRLEHYIDLIEWRPRSVFNAKPVKANVSDALMEIGKKLPGGAKDMVKLLRLCVDCGMDKVLSAINTFSVAESINIDVIKSLVAPDSNMQSIKFECDIKVDKVILGQYDSLITEVAI